MEDEKGFIFTMDAVLMLIPLFIIAAVVANINLVVPHESPYYDSQDALNTMFLLDTNSTIVNNISINTHDSITAARNAERSSGVLQSYHTNYNLTYSINNGGYQVLDDNTAGASPNAQISTATRKMGNITFKLYLWE